MSSEKTQRFHVMKIDSCWWQHDCFSFTSDCFFWGGEHIFVLGSFRGKYMNIAGEFLPFEEWAVGVKPLVMTAVYIGDEIFNQLL